MPPYLSRTLGRLAHDGPKYVERESFFLPESERLHRFSRGDRKVEIGEQSVEVTSQVIKDAYEWAQTMTENLRSLGGASQDLKTLHRFAAGLQGMAAVQRLSQVQLDKLTILVRSLAQSDYDCLVAAMPGGALGPFGHAMSLFMESETLRRRPAAGH